MLIMQWEFRGGERGQRTGEETEVSLGLSELIKIKVSVRLSKEVDVTLVDTLTLTVELFSTIRPGK